MAIWAVLVDPATGEPYRAVGGGGGGGGGDASALNQTRTQAAPGSNSTVATGVQGVDGGKPVGVTATNTVFGSTALVVTGDQSYAVGEQRQITMAPSGGVKVGVSYNANINPAAPTAGGLNSALMGAKYYATRPAWADGNTGALQVDSGGNLYTTVANFPASQAVTGPLTDTQLRASAVPVSGTFYQATQPVSGPLTDAQLRASAVPVSGPLTDTQLRAAAVGVNAGINPAGTSRQLFTGTNGGLLPGQATPTTTRTAVPANPSAAQGAIDIARAGRLGWELSFETSPTAAVFVALGRTATATDYDYMFASGTAIGTQLTALFGFTGAVSLFSTAAVTVAAKSWLAQ